MFSVYAEPDLRAERITTFHPQMVQVTYKNEYGWALISTMYGEYWVYLNANHIFIDRPTGIFTNQGDTTPISTLSPQTVTALERNADWLQIGTWLGSMWIYLNFTPPTNELDAMLRRFGNNLSVYYKNLDTGFVYRYNADRVYFGASISKASFALYIYQMAERGEIDLDTRLTFTSADQNWGSGIIQNRYTLGTTFTIRELLRLNLSYSDNVATLMLVRHFGIGSYRQFVAELGANPARVRSRVMDSDLTANDVGIFARAIHEYIESDGRYSEEFKAHLLNNQFPFIVSDYPVASKTGWTAQRAWHDMAIVYAPSPYILVIMSARDGWTVQDYRDFAEISMVFQRFNDVWFVER